MSWEERYNLEMAKSAARREEAGKGSGANPDLQGTPVPGNSVSGGGSDISKLMAMGWTKAQASGIAANIQVESSGNPNAKGDSGQAYGLAQWHPDRQADFAKWAGHDIRTATRDEQLAFINYELRAGSKQKAGRALSAATDAGQAGDIVSRLYESPKDKQGEATKRAALSKSIFAGSGDLDAFGTEGLTYGAEASAKSYVNNSVANNRTANDNSTQGGTTNINAINIYTQATDAKGIAATIGPNIQRTKMAAQAQSGAV